MIYFESKNKCFANKQKEGAWRKPTQSKFGNLRVSNLINVGGGRVLCSCVTWSQYWSTHKIIWQAEPLLYFMLQKKELANDQPQMSKEKVFPVHMIDM